MSLERIKIFSGNANPNLSSEILNNLEITQSKAFVGRFSDGESQIEILDNVRGCDVFVIQPTCGPSPAETLMELLVMVDALRRSSAGRITAVIPYYGYGRQDRRVRSERMPISAKVMADILERSGIDKVLTVELHSEQIQGFFHIPVDNVYGTKIFHDDIIKLNLNNKLIVSPDVGGVVRSRALAKVLGLSDLAIIDKRRPKSNIAQVMNIIGDIEGANCILLDDMIDTAGTITQAAAALMENGAKCVDAYATHPVLSGPAIERLQDSPLRRVVVTDTIPLAENAKNCSKIEVVSIAPLLAKALRRIHLGESVSTLFV